MAKYRVRRYQAVWEKTTFEVVVPSNVDEEEHEDWIRENYDELYDEAYPQADNEITDSVDYMDTETNVERID